MRRLVAAVAAVALCLSVTTITSSPVGAKKKEFDCGGRGGPFGAPPALPGPPGSACTTHNRVVVREGTTCAQKATTRYVSLARPFVPPVGCYAGVFSNFAERAAYGPSVTPGPDECALEQVFYCDVIPVNIVPPQAFLDGGDFDVIIDILPCNGWPTPPAAGKPIPPDVVPGCFRDNTKGIAAALYDDKQIKAAIRQPGDDGWDPQGGGDLVANVKPYTLIDEAVQERDPITDQPVGPPNARQIRLEHPDLEKYNLVVVNKGIANPSPTQTVNAWVNYAIEIEILVEEPPVPPFEIGDPELNPIPFVDTPFTPLPEVTGPVASVADALDLPLVTQPLTPRVLPSSSVTIETVSDTPPEPESLGLVDASLDPFLQGIKRQNLDEELAGPPLEVAAAQEDPPVPPSGTSLLLSLLAIPVIGGFGYGGFLLRRRAAFKLV